MHHHCGNLDLNMVSPGDMFNTFFLVSLICLHISHEYSCLVAVFNKVETGYAKLVVSQKQPSVNSDIKEKDSFTVNINDT